MAKSTLHKPIRQSNIELLRIFAMFLIIVHHFNVHTPFAYGPIDANSFNPTFFTMALLCTGGIGNVIFMIITGYFSVNSRFNFRKIISLILEMYLYSTLALAIAIIVNRHPISWRELRASLLPIPFGNWFCAYYVLFSLFIPFLNKLIHHLSKKEFTLLLSATILVFSILPTLTNVPQISSMMMFFVGYLIGSYIQLHTKPKQNRNKLLLTLLITILLMAAATTIRYLATIFLNIPQSTAKINFYANENFSIFVIIIATTLFLLFRSLNIGSNKLVNTIARSTLGVYLIHDNEIIRGMIWRRFAFINPYTMNPFSYIGLGIIIGFFIFIACTLVDRARIVLVSKLEQNLSNKIYTFIGRHYHIVEHKLKSPLKS